MLSVLQRLYHARLDLHKTAIYLIEPVMLGTNHQVYWQATEKSFIL